MSCKIQNKIEDLKSKAFVLACGLSNKYKTDGEIREIHKKLYAINYTIKELKSLKLEV